MAEKTFSGIYLTNPHKFLPKNDIETISSFLKLHMLRKNPQNIFLNFWYLDLLEKFPKHKRCVHICQPTLANHRSLSVMVETCQVYCWRTLVISFVLHKVLAAQDDYSKVHVTVYEIFCVFFLTQKQQITSGLKQWCKILEMCNFWV